jgi:hypothetical protein
MMSKIFGHAAGGASSGGLTTASTQGATGPGPAQPSSAGAPGAMGSAPAQSGQSTSGVQAGGGSGGATNVDVGAVLDGLAAKNSQKLDWKHSIVDMMKLLDMDSSLSARKELASELHYSGDSNDSAAMNIWLHKQVMQKLAENGGKVPDELKH